MDAFCLLLVLPLFFVTIALKATRWKYILETQRICIPVGRVFRYYYASIFWGIITPGRIGEGVKILYLANENVSSGRASLSVVLDRLFDLGPVLILTGIGTAIIFDKLKWFILTTAVLGFILLMIYSIRNRLRFSAICYRLSSFLPSQYRATVLQFVDEFRDDIKNLSFSKAILLSTFSCLIWFAYSFPFLVLANDLGIKASPFFIFNGVLCASVIAMVPISIGGLGTRDAFFLSYFGQIGIPNESSVLFSFMFIYMYLFNIAVGFISQPNKKIIQRASYQK